MGFHKVGVLLGGLSSEREVSLASGQAVAEGLRRSGFEVVEIDVDRDLDRRLREADVEAVFIALHGKWGEDGTVQGLLEMRGIPYTGSGVTASAAAMDKHLTRSLLRAAGIPTADGFLLGSNEPIQLPEGWSFPVVVKPPAEGSSVGVSIAKNTADFVRAVDTLRPTSRRVLIERFVAGKEVQTAVLGERILGAVEVEPLREFYDYEAKYTEGGAIHHIPPRISEELSARCSETAKLAYDALGCAGLARIDLIASEGTEPIVLEINTIPGMTELSLAPEIAAAAGMPFDALVTEIMNRATLHT